MNIMVIGSGGREHALAWRVAKSPDVTRVFVVPGNAGTGHMPKSTNVNIDTTDVEALVEFAQQNDIDLTIVGPEAPLVAGVVDAFTANGLRCFGPTAGAAQLEGSKTFSKDFLVRHNIPTAAYQSFVTLAEAEAYIRVQGAPLVVKADGLAAGKGVVIAHSVQAALDAARDMLDDGRFGSAGARIVVEQFLEGEEASFIVVADGESIVALATSQDHKARDEGDQGPNTGGMGAYSPAPVVDEQLHARVMAEVIEPTVRGMAAEGLPYTGFLYAGLMIATDGTVYVLEFNCRLGDPETQPIMMRLKSDLVALCNAAIDKTLDTYAPEWDERVALGVVLAAGGYPESFASGDVIEGLGSDSGICRVFHAGTRSSPEGVVTSGGRVLCVCALGDTVGEAQALAHARAESIQWDNVYYRKDIGYRAIARESAGG